MTKETKVYQEATLDWEAWNKAAEAFKRANGFNPNLSLPQLDQPFHSLLGIQKAFILSAYRQALRS